jgi:Predicted ATPase
MILESSLAMDERLILISFPNSFTGAKMDRNLLEKMTTEEELSGLFNLAVKGLKRLQKQKKFSNEGTIIERREKYKRRSASVECFFCR